MRRAHQIVVLDEGRVAETGTHDALLAKNGVYAALWREQERARGWRLGVSSPPLRSSRDETLTAG